MTTQIHQQPYLAPSMSLAMAQARIAELRTNAERARVVRIARGPRRAPSWPASVAAALRDSLTGALPASRSAVRRQTCTTC
jgi:hypothetical protein